MLTSASCCHDGGAQRSDCCGRIFRLLRYLSAVAFVVALAGCGDDGSECAFTTCGDGGLCSPEECDDRNTRPGDGCSPTCTIEEPACQDCIYRGQTSQAQPFEVQVEGGAITRIVLDAVATQPACSSGSGCIGSAQVCFEILFDPPAPACVLPGGDCDDCPSSGSCLALSGEFFPLLAHGEVDASLEEPPGCFVSLEPDPVTWSATCIPGATPSTCPLAATSTRRVLALNGHRVFAVLTSP